ncbi:S1C family serine protease [Mycobacterium sp.]|uniref:S1C family serine protease n=1 Tax=Mycobacterium sp. TaxID=1785 RepID=UPI002D4FE5D2|nr:S1C family serine protease [Mycobacterium sp.]HZA12509.1 S1C family serine protease [Mycobacterium sp.]
MGGLNPRRSSIWLAVLAAIALVAAAPLYEPVRAPHIGLAGHQLDLVKQAPGDPADPLGTQTQAGVVQINTTIDYQNATGTGTGIVLSPGGEVLTNNHVVSGANSINATNVGTGRAFPVDVLGYDRKHDVALVQLVGANGLPTAAIGDSNQLAVGQPVVAIGNAGGTGSPLSHESGKVTALNQTVVASDDLTGNQERLTGLIEAALDMRPGDSGGPLVNSAGQVVGLNTAAALNYELGTPAGHGYAIPINEALGIAAQIRAGAASSSVHIGDSALLGVAIRSNRRPSGSGVAVQGVMRGGPAEAAGVRPGDVLTAVDGTALDSANTLTAILDQHHPGDTVTVTWTDGSGAPHSAPIPLGKGPAG